MKEQKEPHSKWKGKKCLDVENVLSLRPGHPHDQHTVKQNDMSTGFDNSFSHCWEVQELNLIYTTVCSRTGSQMKKVY